MADGAKALETSAFRAPEIRYKSLSSAYGHREQFMRSALFSITNDQRIH